MSRAPAILHVQMKFKAATHFRASSLMWVSPSRWWTVNWEISQPWVWNYYCLNTSSLPNHINNAVNKCNSEKSVTMGIKALRPQLAINIFYQVTASHHDFTTSKVTLWKPKKHSSLDSWMCAEHSMPKRNSNMELIRTLMLQPMWSTTKECVQMHIFNDKFLVTSARILYKNRNASLDCINELCNAIDSTVGTVHKNFTSQHQIEALKFGRMQHVKCIAWNKCKVWKPKQYEITTTLLKHNILQLQLLS